MNDIWIDRPIYKYTLDCFWILMIVNTYTYFYTCYSNGEEKADPTIRAIESFWPIPHSFKWETYVMTSQEIENYLTTKTAPKKILANGLFKPEETRGDFYILFRCKTEIVDFYGGDVKFYVSGLEYPIEYTVYAGLNDFKDYIIPIHVKESRLKSAPNVTVRWRSIHQF